MKTFFVHPCCTSPLYCLYCMLVSSSVAHGNVFCYGSTWHTKNIHDILREDACFGWQYAKVSKLSLWQAAVCPCGSLYFTHCLKNFRVKTNQQTPQPYWTTTNTHILFATAHPHPTQCCLRAPIENCHQLEALVITFAWRREKTHCSPEKDDRERERGWESERCRVRRGWKAREWERWIERIMNKKSKGDK